MTTLPTLEPSDEVQGPVTAAARGSRSPRRIVGAVIAGNELRRSVATVTAILIVIVVVFAVTEPDRFATAANLRTIGLNSAYLLVLAVGMTFVIASGGFDLSVSSVLVFAGVAGVKAMDAVGGDDLGTALVGLVACLVAGAGWGLVNGLLIAKAKVTPIIVTLGTFTAVFGVTLILSGGIDLSDIPPSLINDLGFGDVLGIPAPLVVAVVVAIGAALLLHTTRFGRHALLIGSNAQAAERFGIHVARHQLKLYALSGACAGLAGYLSVAIFSSTTINGHSTDSLLAIVAVVIGGTSLFGGVATIFGTVVGVLIPAVFDNGFVILGLSSYWQQVATGAVLVLVVYGDQVRRRRAATG